MARKKKNSATKRDARGYGQPTPLPSSSPQMPTVAAPTQPPARRPISSEHSSPSSSSMALVWPKTSTAAPTTPAVVSTVVTAATQQDLEDLLKRLSTNSSVDLQDSRAIDSPMVSSSGPSDRFQKRLASIYDRLVALGFADQDDARSTATAMVRPLDAKNGSDEATNEVGDPLITNMEAMRQVVRALGYDITLESALDWLCFHLPTTALPPLFTEGQVRTFEKSAHVGIDSNSTLEVVTPSVMDHANRASGTTEFAANSLHEHMVASLKIAPTGVANNTETELVEDGIEDENVTAQKAWLLQQYAYVDDAAADDDDDQHKESVVGRREGIVTEPRSDSRRTDVPTASTGTSEEEATIADVASSPPSPDEIRLAELEAEFAALTLDVKDDAANYMRSKFEVKELQKRHREMKQRLQGLQRKVSKQKRATLAAAPKNTEVPENCEDPPGVAALKDCEEEEGVAGMFSMFEEKAAEGTSTTNPQSQPSEVRPDIVIPEDATPKGWTGKTPADHLEELCRKEKIPKPLFFKLSKNGCRLKIRTVKKLTGLDGSMELEIEGPIPKYDDARHYLSVKALYKIHPSLPLHRLFAPFFKDLWISFVRADEKERNTRIDESATKRQQNIDDLLNCISTSVDVKRSQKSLSEPMKDLKDADTAERLVDGDWDDDVDDEPSFTSMLHPTNSKVSDLGERMKQTFLNKSKTSEYKLMLNQREQLPMHAYRAKLLESIRSRPVTILSAATGAGKTTQCPQFILEDALVRGKCDQVSILCTQPRRVAATSVAMRVADEMVDPIGNLVGYQIRMEAKRSAQTRLLFCTTGIVLRRLVEDPKLEGISHVIVDEVHERQWQIDILLVTLRRLLSTHRPDLKVILMSATLDATLFTTFFHGAPLLSVPGRTFPVATYHLEDILERTGHIIEEGSKYSKRQMRGNDTVQLFITGRGGEKHKQSLALDGAVPVDVSDDYEGYSMSTRRSMDRVDETVVNYDLIEDLLRFLVEDEKVFPPPEAISSDTGSILIFMPGLGEIRSLVDSLSGSRRFGNGNKFDIIPMHSALSAKEQRRAFQKSQPGTRKIIISTNIAETSVTIPDVTCVIDSGRVREIQNDKRTSTPRLLAGWCSRASTKQRAGRAGRVQAGVCLKLFSSHTENIIMRQASEPELRRVPLEEVCLTILAAGYAKNCHTFLAETPQPPREEAVEAALAVLADINAVRTESSNDSVMAWRNSSQTLTPLGRHLAKLPMDARLGKILLLGSLFACLDAVLTIVASLSASQSPFQSFYNSQNSTHAKAVHAGLRHPTSDFLTYINIWQGYCRADAAGKKHGYCRDNFLNATALREIRDARWHFLDLLSASGFVDRGLAGFDKSKQSRGAYDEAVLVASIYCKNSRKEEVIHAVLSAGLYPNIGKLEPAVSGRRERAIMQKKERLWIHSSSVNSKEQPQVKALQWMSFHEKFGNASRTSVSTTCYVHPFALMLFGPSLKVLHTERKVLVGDWILLEGVAAKTGVIFREIRNQMDTLLSNVMKQQEGVDSTHSGPENSEIASFTQIVDAVGKLLVAR